MTFNIFGLKIELRKEIIIVIVISFVFLAGLGGYLIVKSNRDIIIDSKSQAIEETKEVTPDSSLKSETITGGNPEKVSSNDTGEKAEEIKIYVTGCVKNQGIVTLIKGQLIDDALRLAGGATKEADLGSINLVYKLEENTMLYIKSRKEIQSVSQSANDAGEAGKGIKIIKDSGGAVVNENRQASISGGKININKASIDELDTLPGIGQATAQDIISYRENNGPFKTIQDIMKVPRIKETRFEKIKDFITID